MSKLCGRWRLMAETPRVRHHEPPRVLLPSRQCALSGAANQYFHGQPPALQPIEATGEMEDALWGPDLSTARVDLNPERRLPHPLPDPEPIALPRAIFRRSRDGTPSPGAATLWAGMFDAPISVTPSKFKGPAQGGSCSRRSCSGGLIRQDRLPLTGISRPSATGRRPERQRLSPAASHDRLRARGPPAQSFAKFTAGIGPARPGCSPG